MPSSFSFFTNFFEIILHPKEVAAQLAGKGNWKSAIGRYAAVGLVVGFLGGIGAAMTQPNFSNLISYLFPNILIPYAISSAIISVLFGFIGWAVFVMIARIFGNKLSLEQNMYVGSRVFGPMMVINLILLALVNVFNPIIFIFGLWQIWNAYVHIAAASGANNISMKRAFGYVLGTFVVLAGAVWTVVVWFSHQIIS